MAERKPQGNDLIFALDIGTRSVVGVVGKAVEDRFKVLAVEAEEHKKRAMLDGQIDNIQQVADLVKAVTERERNLDVRLERVCVAAAKLVVRSSRLPLRIRQQRNSSRSMSWKPEQYLPLRTRCRWTRRAVDSFSLWAIRLHNTAWTAIRSLR